MRLVLLVSFYRLRKIHRAYTNFSGSQVMENLVIWSQNCPVLNPILLTIMLYCHQYILFKLVKCSRYIFSLNLHTSLEGIWHKFYQLLISLFVSFKFFPLLTKHLLGIYLPPWIVYKFQGYKNKNKMQNQLSKTSVY